MAAPPRGPWSAIRSAHRLRRRHRRWRQECCRSSSSSIRNAASRVILQLRHRHEQIRVYIGAVQFIGREDIRLTRRFHTNILFRSSQRVGILELQLGAGRRRRSDRTFQPESSMYSSSGAAVAAQLSTRRIRFAPRTGQLRDHRADSSWDACNGSSPGACPENGYRAAGQVQFDCDRLVGHYPVEPDLIEHRFDDR